MAVVRSLSHQHQCLLEAGAASVAVSAVVSVVEASVGAEAASGVEAEAAEGSAEAEGTVAETTLAAAEVAGEGMVVEDSGADVAAEASATKVAASTTMDQTATEDPEDLAATQVVPVAPVAPVDMGLQGAVLVEALEDPEALVGMDRPAVGTAVGIAETSSATAAPVGMTTARQNVLVISLAFFFSSMLCVSIPETISLRLLCH